MAPMQCYFNQAQQNVQKMVEKTSNRVFRLGGMDDVDEIIDTSGGSKKGKKGMEAKTVVKVGFVMLFVSMLMLFIGTLDDGPDADDYDSGVGYSDAYDAYETRADFYPAAFVMLLLGGVVAISGGLVQGGITESETHNYVRIATIVSGVLLLIAFLEFLEGVITAVTDLL